jgi:hypothetical protein
MKRIQAGTVKTSRFAKKPVPEKVGHAYREVENAILKGAKRTDVSNNSIVIQRI